MDKRRWGVTCPCAQQVNSPIVPQSCVRAGVDLSTKGEEREGICRCVSGREGNRRRRRGGTGSHLAELKIRSNRGFRAPTIEILRRLAKNIFLPSTFHIPPFVVEIKKIYRETRKFLSLSRVIIDDSTKKKNLKRDIGNPYGRQQVRRRKDRFPGSMTSLGIRRLRRAIEGRKSNAFIRQVFQ